MFSSIAPVQDFVRDGRLVGLATTGPKRDPAFPDLPTIAESGYPGFDVRLWIGHDGAGRHPEGHHPEARRRQQQGAGIAGDPEGAGRPGLCADDRHRRRTSTPSTAPSATNGPRSSRKPAWTRTRRQARNRAGRALALGLEPDLPLSNEPRRFCVRFGTNDCQRKHHGLDHPDPRRDLHRPRDQRLSAGRILISLAASRLDGTDRHRARCGGGRRLSAMEL